MDTHTGNTSSGSKTERWFWVAMGEFTFGFSSVDGIVTRVPPKFKWAKGKTLTQIRPYLIEKKAKVIELK